MRYIFNPITEQLEAPDNPSPLYENLGKKFKLAESVLPYDFDDLTPKEEQYYQQDKFSTHPEFLAAKGGRVGFQDGSEWSPKQEAYFKSLAGRMKKNRPPITPIEMKKLESLYSSKYNNLKGKKLIDALYKDGEQFLVNQALRRFRAGIGLGETKALPTGEIRDAIIEAHKKFKKANNKIPRTNDILNYKSVSKLMTGQPNRKEKISYISEVLRKNKLDFIRGKKLMFGSKQEWQRAANLKRKLNIQKFSNPYIEKMTVGKHGLKIPGFKIGPWEFKGRNIGGIHKHHMNSLRQNVNLRNVVYISGSDNWWLKNNIEKELGKIYAEREDLLKNKPKDWKTKVNGLNDKGRNVLKKLPERLKGLLNFEVVEVKPNGVLKSSNIGMDWRKSIGAEAGEIGKIDFKKLTQSQQKKILALHADQYKAFKAKGIKTGAAGTAGGLGVALGAVAAGAEHQAGKPWYDVFINLPVEFASFGMIPATEISQQLRIRGDLKDKGLSFSERNKKMALYNRGKAQEAIDKDEVGLESYALSGLKEGETMDQSHAVRGDEDIELMERKIKRGYNPETGKWESERFVDEVEFAEGGIVPRVGYKDGSNWLDKLTDDDVYNLSRGWRTDMKMDPDVMDRIKQKEILDAQAANEAGFKHRSQYEDTGSFIPEYVQDVVKKGFGTKEGLKYIGSKAGEGAVEGFEWFIYQLPHLVKELDKRGLMPGLDGQALNKMKKHLEKNKGKFNWMELMYTPNWGEEFLGFKMNDFQKKQIEKLKDRFGETEIPEGIASTGTAAELGAMFVADPFIIWGAGSKLSKLKGKKDKLVNVDETIDVGRRDFTKTVGTVGLTAFLAKTFPFLFKTKKDLTAAKNVAKVAETVKQFGNVRGMPEWLPSFILKAKNDGKLLSLPDKHYVEGFVYNIDLPVKRKYYTSTNKDRGIHIKSDPDGNPITSKGEKDHWGTTGRHTETRIEKVPVRVEINPNSGEIMIHWKGIDNYGDEIDRSMFYKPGETGTQNYAVDEFGRGTSKEEVVIQDPEFEYTEPDWGSAGPDDTPDSPLYLDAWEDADEIVEAMEEFVKGSSKEFKKQAANEMKLYNQTDEHFGDATGHQTSDGDWVSGDDNMPFPSYDKEVKDVYHPKWNRKKKAMGGKASGRPPLSGPVPEGLRSLKPGAIYNEWIN